MDRVKVLWLAYEQQLQPKLRVAIPALQSLKSGQTAEAQGSDYKR